MDLDMQYELRRLKSLNIEDKVLSELEVILLPENFGGEINSDSLQDAQDGVQLSKLLKNKGVRCVNSYDLHLEIPTRERRSNDFWFGEIFILKDIAIPVITGVLSSMLSTAIQKKADRKDERSPTPKVHAKLTVRKKEITSIEFDGEPEDFLKILDICQDKTKAKNKNEDK